MKRALLAVSAALIPALLSAAEIHGVVSDGGKPVPQGVGLKLDCGSASAEGKTDEYGSYSLKLAATGECKLSLSYQGSTGSLTVTLYDKPSKYDLAVRKDGDKLSLARK